MNQLSDRLNRLTPSATLAMSQKSSELKAQGVDVINMSVGEPDFNTPEAIKEAAKKAIDENYSKYSPVAGYPALRNAIASKLKNENDLKYTANQITVANGAKQSVCNTVMCLVNEGDEVIIPAPYWVSYPQMVKLADGTPITIYAGIDQDFKITPAQLEAAITPKTKALILCSPSNPTGSVYSKNELEDLAKVIAKHPDMFVIADEIYEHINYIGKHESIAQFKEIKDRVIIINGVSKAYAMTGWRIGFAAGPEWIIKGINKLQGQYTSGPSSVSQKAAEAAYTGSQQCVEDMRKAFERRRDLIVKLAKEIPGLEVNVPQGAFYLFPKCDSFYGKSYGDRKINNSNDLAMFLLEVGHVATVGGDSFGAPDCFRMSYATSDENIEEAMKRIKRALSLLK
ncbi:pyridoxal phosphate-dependent aminotransferase [Phocaeicola oris]|uniref:pyridoxal phosphate-dependent aminotransferase n=1 Tax=Phocaeicola oris TaxID=2896850 RepID=UPI00234E477A|nr:pyridoxal phosphate-dependent aminotransferase [Phocaeicola oris]MCE2616219.1 pyridoxal phosphate-dependent aminotransferase [Phocaeicola oris]